MKTKAENKKQVQRIKQSVLAEIPTGVDTYNIIIALSELQMTFVELLREGDRDD